MCTGDFSSASSFFSSSNSTSTSGTDSIFSKIGSTANSTSAGQWLKMGGQAIQGVSSLTSANENASSLQADASSERSAAARQASLILKNANKTRGAARAATAASGARVDEFSLMNENEIMQAGQVDASMAVLSGERRARSLEQQASQQSKSGSMSMLTSLTNIGSTFMQGWK